MKKSMLLLLSIIMVLPLSLWTMDDEEMQEVAISLPSGGHSVTDILQVTDPVKFAALTRQLASRPDRQIHRSRRGPRREQLSREKELELLEQSMAEVTQLNDGILQGLDTLSQQSLVRWNAERKKGLGKAVAWGVTTGGLLGLEGYFLFSKLSSEAKVATGVPLVTAALGTVLKFLEHANKVIGNKHINDQLETQLKKASTVTKTKRNLEKEIDRLREQIERERVRGIGGKGSKASTDGESESQEDEEGESEEDEE